MRPWLRRLALGVGLWAAYTLNGREIGAGDTVPSMLQPIAIARGDGIVLDRFEPVLRMLDPSNAEPGRFPPYYASFRHGHLVSRLTLTPALMTLPLALPQIAFLDARRPGWDATPASVLWYARRIAKNTYAATAAATGVLVFEVLARIGLARVAWPATLVAALGSPLFTTAAQSSWHHGPAALALAASLMLLLGPRGRVTLAATGAALATMVAVRPPMALFALPLAAWATWRQPRDAPWLLAPLAFGGAMLVAYNLLVFGTLAGGQSEIEVVRLPMHALTGSRGSLTAGLAGTLVSPSRGLLLFCPWVVATLALLPTMRPRPTTAPLLAVLALGLAGYLALFAGYSAWWAGWCFGPRYWTEAVPVLAIGYALALDAATRWTRPLLWATGAAGIAIHAIGAAYYPSTWNARPANVDTHHERLWDWRDTELARGFREGPHAREFGLGVW